MSYAPPSYPATSPSSALGMNEIVGVLKEIYDGQKVTVMTYTDNPFLAMVRKNTKFGGKLYPLPQVTEANPNSTSNFTNAQNNTLPVQIDEFILTRVPGYQIAQIQHEAMLAAETDQMSFINGVKMTVDQAIQACVNFVASSLFRSGSGSIGQINSIGVAGTGVIVLQDPNSITQFMKGQVLQANATDGGATPRGALGYIIAMNRSQGQFTVSATAGGSAGTPSGWQATDFLLVQGTLNSTISGLSAWLVNPAVLTSTPFFSVNRTTDSTRLAGVYYNGSAQSIEEALIDSSSLLAREGGKPDVGITNYGSYSALEKSLGAKVTYTQLTTTVKGEDGKAEAEIAFRGIMVNGANSQFRVFPDRSCQGFQAWLLEMRSWELLSIKDCPHIFNYGDDLQMLRMASNDAAELRIGFYAQLGSNAVGHNASVVLGA